MSQLTCSQLELASPIILASSALNILGLSQVRISRPFVYFASNRSMRVIQVTSRDDFGPLLLPLPFVF